MPCAADVEWRRVTVMDPGLTILRLSYALGLDALTAAILNVI